MKKLFFGATIGAIIATLVLVLFVKPESTYEIDSIISSIGSDIKVDVCAEAVTTNDILEATPYVIAYRPKDGIKEFPSDAIDMSKITELKVDVYGSFLICYDQAANYKEALDKLARDDRTLFAQRVEYQEISTCDYSIQDIATNAYAADMMNSREFADSLVGSSRKIKVAIMDTGMYNHSSKVANLVVEDGVITYDYVNNDANVFDGIDDHATMVLSVFEQVVEPVIDNMEIYSVKVLEHGRGSSYDFYNALLGMKGKVDIINMSFGGNISDTLTEFAINELTSSGTVVVCAAGNEGGRVSYPAAFDSTIAVSAVDANKRITYFSNYGKQVTFTALGQSVAVDTPNYGSAYANGTSFSSPALTGFATLVMLSDSSIKTTDKLIEGIRKYTEDLGTEGKDDYYGYGLPRYEKKEPVTRPTEPVTKPTEPVTKPTEPVTKPTEPVTKPTEPVTKPTEPVTKPTEPVIPPQKPIVTELNQVTGLYIPRSSHTKGDVYVEYSFNQVENAEYYEIYGAIYNGEDDFGKLDWKLIATTSNCSYRDYVNTIPNVRMLLKVRAVKGNIKGEFSSEYEQDKFLDDSMNLVASSYTAGKIKISWNSNYPGTYGYEINVFEKLPNGSKEYICSKYVDLNITSYEFGGLESGKTYVVEVLNRFKSVCNGIKVAYHGGGVDSVSSVVVR